MKVTTTAQRMLEHNGRKYARVSDIIRPFSNFGHIDPIVLANKARIGTAVHQCIEEDLKGGFAIPEDDEEGYFNSYLKWMAHIKPTFVQFEQRYFCDDLMLTGQIDGLVRLPGEELPILLDFKTSANESPITWPMQAHLYSYLLHVNDVAAGLRFLFLKLDKHGQLPIAFSYHYDQKIHNKCMKSIEEFWNNEKK